MKNKILNLIGILSVTCALGIAFNKYSEEKIMTAGIKIENMDTSVKPGNGFYEYATNGWRKANPIPDDYARYGSLEILYEQNLERVHKIAQTDTGKIGTLYKIIMDEERRNAEKTAPVQSYLDTVDEIKSASDLPEYLGKTHRFVGGFWGDMVALDDKDSEHFIYNIVQGGTGLSRDYYFDTDEKSCEIREKYKKFIADQSANFGIKIDAEKLYALEERLARAFHTKEVLRDPNANYHKMSIDEIKQKLPGFDWDKYLTARGAATATHINIAQPSAIAEAIKIMNDTDIDLIRDYLKFRIIEAADTLLDDKTYAISFDFYNRTIAGQKEQKPKWKRALGILDSTLGEEIGYIYIKEYFPPEAKKRMQELVKNLQRAYAQRIEASEWLSPATRELALQKLDTFKAKIGYPDKWRDYSALEISDNISLWDNMVRIDKFEDAFWMSKIGKENDPTLWYMNAHEINAYYDPATNEICFPAGILQYPFFDMDADDAFNYGAIGAIIGHEMTHGFDDSGRHFDKNGNLNDWWTAEDAKAFETRADVLRQFFNNIEIAPDIKANGEYTLGENLADYGGVTIAFDAYKKFGTPSNESGGLTPEMRFFIAYAGTWAQNIRPEEALRLTKTDEHSLGQNRVNGILPHIDAWYKAFDIQPTDKLYIKPENRIKLW